MNKGDSLYITCEHGGNRIPAGYRDYFSGREAMLRTHRGVDIGALRLARDLAKELDAPLLASTVSRLLVDLNRSVDHPGLFSEMTASLSPDVRQDILARYYHPFRSQAEAHIAQEIHRGRRVVHLSCHSFTPVLDGEVRNADIGLLHDPARHGEAAFCERWQATLKTHAPSLHSRMNYPYLGIDDGFTTCLRRRFSAESYIGIELEINQKHAQHGASHWHAVRKAVIASFRAAMKAASNTTTWDPGAMAPAAPPYPGARG
jgi:predicted N-formylglutamate amidohydrolase